MNVERLKTDVLVIGGGAAGWFAADKARKQGAQVIMLDKGYVGKAGQSVHATEFHVFNEDWGDSMEELSALFTEVGEYINDRYWTRKVMEDSLSCFNDLNDWGVEFKKNEDGSVLRQPIGDCILLSAAFIGSGRENISYAETFGAKARKHMQSIGVQIMDRTMAVEYLKQDGRIRGVVAISVDSDRQFVIEAGATVVCAGSSGYKPEGYPVLVTSTGDSEAMAYRAGGEVRGKEFVQMMHTSSKTPCSIGRKDSKQDIGVDPGFTVVVPKFWKKQDGTPVEPHKGKTSTYPFAYLDLELDAHEGKGPYAVCKPNGEISSSVLVSGAALGLSVRKSDGIWPADHECRTNLPGLYAAGDSLGTMQNGALYAWYGGSIAGCCVTGAIAGKHAAEEALQNSESGLSESEIQRGVEYALAPTKNAGGYSPNWVKQLLKNTLMPYFISSVKSGERLQAALTYVMFMREHLCPKLLARDAHELRLAHETNSMVLCAEIFLRSSLLREESRGMHFREDFPMRDDENSFYWIKIKQEDGKMKLSKVELPEEWKADAEIPYEEKYKYRFPGESLR